MLNIHIYIISKKEEKKRNSHRVRAKTKCGTLFSFTEISKENTLSICRLHSVVLFFKSNSSSRHQNRKHCNINFFNETEFNSNRRRNFVRGDGSRDD